MMIRAKDQWTSAEELWAEESYDQQRSMDRVKNTLDHGESIQTSASMTSGADMVLKIHT